MRDFGGHIHLTFEIRVSRRDRLPRYGRGRGRKCNMSTRIVCHWAFIYVEQSESVYLIRLRVKVLPKSQLKLLKVLLQN